VTYTPSSDTQAEQTKDNNAKRKQKQKLGEIRPRRLPDVMSKVATHNIAETRATLAATDLAFAKTT